MMRMKQKEKHNAKQSRTQELIKEVEGLTEKLKKFQLDRHVKQVKNSREGKNIRKRIAVLLTFIKEKRLAE